MAVPRFVQFHTLISYPGSLLNRDDSGYAKRMPFGGAMRTRISSQCLKRHWRMAGTDQGHEWGLEKIADLSVRSRETFLRELGEPLTEEYPEPIVATVLKAFQDSIYPAKEGASETSGGEPSLQDLKRKEVSILGRPEIKYLMGEAKQICDEVGDDVDKAKAKAKDYVSIHKANLKAMGAGLDAALFGRMIAADPSARIDAAIHVAHAMSVHSEESETDYFTAVDDLVTGESGTGSALLSESELTSALYYSYIVIDIPLLVSNTTGTSSEEFQNSDRSTAARVVEHLGNLITTVTPGAKKGSTAPYAYAEWVMAEIGRFKNRIIFIASCFD